MCTLEFLYFFPHLEAHQDKQKHDKTERENQGVQKFYGWKDKGMWLSAKQVYWLIIIIFMMGCQYQSRNLGIEFPKPKVPHAISN